MSAAELNRSAKREVTKSAHHALRVFGVTNALVAFISLLVMLSTLRLHGTSGDVVKMSAYTLAAHTLLPLGVLTISLLISSVVIQLRTRPASRRRITISAAAVIAVIVSFVLLRTAP